MSVVDESDHGFSLKDEVSTAVCSFQASHGIVLVVNESDHGIVLNG